MALLIKKITASTTETAYTLPDGTRRVTLIPSSSGVSMSVASGSSDVITLTNLAYLTLDSGDLGNRTLYFVTGAGTADVGLLIYTGTI